MYAGTGKPSLGVTAVFDDAEFNRRMDAHLRRLKQLEDKLDNLATAAESSADRQKRASKSTHSALSRNIRAVRWELVTLLFFFRIASRGIVAAFKLMEEAGQGAAERMGIRALARRMETDLGGVASQVRQVNQSVMSVGESYNVTLQGILQDQGQFSDQYARLWEAARVAAVTGMTDADTAFKAFVADLRDGTGAATDAISPIYGVGRALEEYARSTGRTVEQLDQLEAAHITLQQVYRETNNLLDDGARAALDAQAGYQQLQAAWKDLRQVGGELVNESGVLPIMAMYLRLAAIVTIGWAAAISTTIDKLKELGKSASAWDFASILGTEMGGAIRGDPSEALEKHLKRYFEVLGVFSDQSDKSRMDYDELRGQPEDTDYGPLVDHLLKREKLVEDHRSRLLKLERSYNTRVDRIDRRHQINVDRIQRSAQLDRDRALRSYHRRRDAIQRRQHEQERRLEAAHQLKLEQNRREYRLRSIQSEALYLYERSLLHAYGDVLAIEDLDARYALEKEARKQNFDEQQRQERENYALRTQQQRAQFQQQMDDLQAMLEEQLKEIGIREAERIAEAAIRREEELLSAKKDYDAQVEAEQASHKRSLDQWAEYWVKLAQRFDLGLQDIKMIIASFFGTGGDVDNIMTTFIAKWNSYMAKLLQMKRLMESMKRGASGLGLASRGVGIPGRDFPFQYGGGGVFSSPTRILVGESGPEMVSVSPMTSLTNVNVQWRGGPIPIQGSGLEGADVSGLGDTIAQGLLVGLERGITRAGATYG